MNHSCPEACDILADLRDFLHKMQDLSSTTTSAHHNHSSQNQTSASSEGEQTGAGGKLSRSLVDEERGLVKVNECLPKLPRVNGSTSTEQGSRTHAGTESSDQNANSILCTSITSLSVSSVLGLQGKGIQDYKNEQFDTLEEQVQLVLNDLTLKLSDIGRLIAVRELGELIHEDENKRLQTRRDILRDCSILVLLVHPTWLSTTFVSQVFDLLCVNRAVFVVSISNDPVDKTDLQINNQNLQIFDSRGSSIERLVHLIKARTSLGREEHGADIVTFIYR